jgi:hypothetical protein
MMGNMKRRLGVGTNVTFQTYVHSKFVVGFLGKNSKVLISCYRRLALGINIGISYGSKDPTSLV